MLCFGPLSSLFDVAAFFILYGVMHVGAAQFQTAWFVESMATQVLVIFVIRSRRAAWRDRPSTWLALGSIAIVALAFALPFAPFGDTFGFEPLPAPVLALVLGLTVAYLAAAEGLKHIFYRWRGAAARHAAPPALVAPSAPQTQA
jgi:Mg2+-importing ATPase